MRRGATLFSTIAVWLLISSVLYAHPGMTDAQGCHTNLVTGDYHCHGSRSRDGVGFATVISAIFGLLVAFAIWVFAKKYFNAWYENSTEAGRRRAASRVAVEAVQRELDAQRAKDLERRSAGQMNHGTFKGQRTWKRRRRRFTKRN
jgi:hypothetical protein